jgi:hypothetical protein
MEDRLPCAVRNAPADVMTLDRADSGADRMSARSPVLTPVAGETPHAVAPDAGPSAELSSVFRTVAETDWDGRPKFDRATISRLARLVAARAYAKRLTELCHLAVAAGASDRQRRYEELFWNSGPACPGAFRAHFRKRAASGAPQPPLAEADNGALTLRYPDGEHQIAFGRMPLLSALLEFAVTALGYAEVDRHLRPLARSDVHRRSVETAANGLARSVHGFLAAHLPSAQTLRKFRMMAAFLEARCGGAIAPESIDDGVVMDFWMAQSAATGAEDLGVRTYRSVFRAFVRFHAALYEARDRFNLDHPRSLGDMRSGENFDAAQVDDSLAAMDEPTAPLHGLPPQIRFFNRRETQALAALLFPGRLRESLALSVMRCCVFGDAQGRLVNALQRGAAGGDLAPAIFRCLGDDYVARTGAHGKLADHARHVLLASLHVLIRGRHAAAGGVIAALLPDLDGSRARAAITEGAGREDTMAVARFLDALADRPESLGDDIARLAAAAKRAYRAIAREGFRDDDPGGPAAVERFAAAADGLVAIDRALGRFVATLSAGTPDWRRMYDDDRPRFIRQFQSIYGDRDDHAAA